MIKSKTTAQRGVILLNVVVFGLIATGVIVALTSWFAVTWKGARTVRESELAFHIAEAGIEYYRWHLAHAPQDFTDGTGEEGPYVHDFVDAEGNVIGAFSLVITPPETGSTLVTIDSTGMLASTSLERTIRVELAKPSFSKYAFVANSDIRLGEGTEVYGIIHSNEGVRFDGLAHNLVTSAQETYDDPDHSGQKEWGVHTHIAPTDELPPIALADRFDVFEAGREVGVPAVDFDGLTSDMAALKVSAQANGHYYGSSGKQGYHITFHTNDTYTLAKVNSQQSTHNSCNNALGQQGWSSWSIKTQTVMGTYPLPDNGVIFLEDHVWVDGQINTARVTVAAARFPEAPGQYRSIIINDDLLYTNLDGQDVIGLIAQGDINVGMYSDTDLTVHAALIAQHGRVGRYYYRGPWSNKPGCSPYHVRTSMYVYGMIGTNERYGFAYTDNTGYIDREISYDANLLYGPPPEFPLTSDQYEILTWTEL